MKKIKSIFLILAMCLFFVCANGIYAFMKSDMDPKEEAEMVKRSREVSKVKLRQLQLEKQKAIAEAESRRRMEKVERIRPLDKKEESLSANIDSSSIKTMGILLVAIISTFGLLLAVLKAKKH